MPVRAPAPLRALFAALLALPLLALSLRAEPYPQPARMRVNDFAGVLAPEAAARLTASLDALDRDTGIETTVVTIASRADYDPATSLESFATGLFNAWGIGKADQNDGILVLVVRDDREMRVALGSSYGQGYDVTAQELIRSYFIPDAQDGRLSEATEALTMQVIDRVARPFAGGVPAKPARDLTQFLIPGGIAALMLAMIFGRKVFGPGRRQMCPKCGRSELVPDSESGGGVRVCPTCRHREDKPHRMARTARPNSDRGSFGGGKSSGGGASGRWK